MEESSTLLIIHWAEKIHDRLAELVVLQQERLDLERQRNDLLKLSVDTEQEMAVHRVEYDTIIIEALTPKESKSETPST